MVNVGIFYDHLEYFMATWYNLWTFGIVCGLVYCYIFPNLECLDQEKPGNPSSTSSFRHDGGKERTAILSWLVLTSSFEAPPSEQRKLLPKRNDKFNTD
jgi:hypothetical protein